MVYYKLGCNWGANKPDFYKMLLKHSIVICAEHNMSKGDFVAITKGYKVVALAQIISEKVPSTNYPELKQDFQNYLIDYKDWNYVAKALIWEIPKKSIFEYKLQQGICKIQNKDIQKKIRLLISNIMSSKIITDSIKLLEGNYNLILTGAPGTGKTYLAKTIAKEMGCDEDHIGFVQFHPSYDYTDFVEGLRPIKEGDKLGFQRKDGVFKDFCRTALNVPIDATFRELWEDIQRGKIKTLELCDGGNSLPMIIKPNHKNMIYFSKKGSPEEISDSNDVSLKKVKKAFDDDQITSVAKLKAAGPNRDKLGSGGNATNLWAVLNELLKRREKLDTSGSSTSQKYVFIIDEINRGEISKIFGELFYSIDAGYRGIKGRVETQYQNLVPEDDVFSKGFYIPENVYIIGTMNDIDRSVESMDFAMRRRFAWKEITAESRQSMLDEDDAWGTEVKPSKEEIAEMKVRMNNLNLAIIDQYGDEELSNKDKIGLSKAYQIGASYFLKYSLYNNNNFEELWTNHLKGLLYEYLRGKTNVDEKINRLYKAYKDTTPH